MIFWLQVPGMTLYEQCIFPAGAWLQMTRAYNFFRLYALVICDHAPAKRNIEDLTLCLQFPIVTTTLWGQLAGKTRTVFSLQSVITLHCHGCLALSNPYISSALWRQYKCKKQYIYQAMDIPVLLRGWGEAAVTNDWCIIYSL